MGIYLFPFYLVTFSLSVPPSDLPLCGLMFATSACGFALARRESRNWRIVWICALIVSFIFGVLEVVAGHNLARQHPVL
jgi:hypothetical protein